MGPLHDRSMVFEGSGNFDSILNRSQNTISFINDEASSIHGNIRLSSIFTSQSGEWRLGGLEVLSSPKDNDALIYVSPQAIPSLQYG